MRVDSEDRLGDDAEGGVWSTKVEEAGEWLSEFVAVAVTAVSSCNG